MRQRLACVLLLCLGATPGVWAQQTSTPDNNAELRQEVEQLKKNLADLEQRLATQEKKKVELPETPAPAATAGEPAPTTKDLETQVKELNDRVSKNEMHTALDRINFTGDLRYQLITLNENIPTHFDGMALQNGLIRTLFFAQNNGGMPPANLAAANTFISNNYANYQQFLNGLTFQQLKSAVGSFPAAQQQALMGMLMPATLVPAYKYKNTALQTLRLRLNMDAKMTDNLTFSGRLSMYKVFGDSTAVQVFDGQPQSLNVDGTTTRVPNSDILRVERAYFTWSNIAGLPLYLSIGRRPSTDGPPMNLRQDEPRGGTPMGSLIDYQFDGITVGYHIGDKTTLRACYGVGYESGWGNGDVLQMPQDRLSDTQLIGGNFDIWSTDKTLVQATVARAFNVTDGFPGVTVFTLSPLTGESAPPAVIRFTPSNNFGAIDLAGFLVQHRVGPLDVFGNVGWSGFRPTNVTGPFGGLGSNPFDVPANHDGYMIYAGARYNFANGKTKLGFEFNHGSKYWFNFAQAQDDIVAPKTSTRGNVYETYLTHRFNRFLIAKLDYEHYTVVWSGSGWDVGAPQKLSDSPVLGFPTFNSADQASLSLTARF